MKLHFLFLLMDVFILIAYPIVFLHGRLHQYLRTAKLLVIGSVAPAS
jgi:hypothetical protein